MEDVLKFISEVLGIIFLGSSYSIYLDNDISGRIVVIIGIAFLLFGRWDSKKDKKKHCTL